MTRRALMFALALIVPPAGSALAGPGGGNAAISPPDNIQGGKRGTWTIVYNSPDKFNNGTVRVTIPPGWTAPQQSSSTSAGYTTVSSDAPTGAPPVMSIVGNVITVDVDTLDVGLTLTIVYGDVSGGSGGRAKAASAKGLYEFSVADHPTSSPAAPIASSPTIDITVGAPLALDPQPGDTTVTAGDFAAYTIFVLDDVGAHVPVLADRTVGLIKGTGDFYLPSDHGTPITEVTIPLGEDSARVDYMGTLAGTYPLAMQTNDGLSPGLSGNTNVTIAPAAVDASTSEISASTPVVADGSSQSSVSVTSRDQYGNPIPGDSVAIAVDGDAVEIQPGSFTNASGVATGAVTNTTAELVTVSATIEGTPIIATAPITFVSGGADADSSQIAATSPVTADGVSASTITVTARDVNGNPVSGATVTLSVSPSGDGEVLTQPGGVTGSNGQATGTLSSTKTGIRVVKAMVGVVSIGDSAEVAFVPGPIASFEWTVDGASTAGAYEPATLTARDAQGNIKTDYTGLVNLSTTSGGTVDSVVTWGVQDAINTPTNGSGDQATYQFASLDSGSVVLSVRNYLMETYRLNASGDASGQSADIVNNHAVALLIEIVEGDGQSATVGTSVATPPRVRVTDEFDNPVDGETVTFAPLSTGSSIDVVAGGGVQTTGLTDAAGELDCDVWTLADTAKTNTLRASIGAGSPIVDFTATGTPDVGASIDIAPASKSVTVGASEVVTLTLKDQYGNIVEGERVDVFISDAADGSLAANPGDPNPTTTINSSARWGNSDSNGQISVLYQAPGTASLSDVVDASTTLIPASSVTDAVYTTTASGATNLRITFVGPSTVAAGQTFQFLVEAIDGSNNVDTSNGSTVTLTPEAGSGILFSESDFGTPVTQVTLSSGTATVYGQGTKARAVGWDITVDDAGPLASDTKKVTITDTGLIDHYFVSSVDSVLAGVSFNVTIEARDAYDNLVDSASNTVNLAAVQPSDSTLTSSTLSVIQTTLVSGQANVGESYTKAETILVRARDGSSHEGFSGSVKVKPAAANRIFYISGNASDVVAGGTQPLVVEVRDAYDNPVPGESVTFVATSGGGSVSPSPVVTGADGRSTSTLTTGTTVGTNTVAATILGGTPPDERVDFDVQTVPGAIDHFVVTPAKTSATAGEVFGVDVVAKDANNNTVTTDDATVVSLSSVGDMQFTTVGAALSAGTFSTTMWDTTAETVVVTASGGGKTGDSPSITISNAALYRIVYVSGDASGLPVNARQTLEVEAQDLYGNTVSGAGVTFQVVSAPGPAGFRDAVGDTTDGITTTNGAGRATVDLLTAPTAGTHDVKATILTGTPPDQRVDFAVSTVAGGVDHYEVLLAASSQTAGVPLGVTVRALDASDNLVSSDNTTSVTLSLDPGGGPVVWGANPVILQAGTLQTTVTLAQVQTFNVRARSTLAPSVTGLSAAATITPSVPFDTITATPNPATITATGLTWSDVTSGVIRDQYLNQVAPGELVDVAETANLVTFDSDDQDLVRPGLQRSVNASGQITFRVHSKTTPGLETVTMQSVNGSASGSVPVTLAPPPAFTTNDPPVPDVAYVGETVQFNVPVTNTSTTDARLNASTSFTFTDGTHTYTAGITGLPDTLYAGVPDTLVFANVQVSFDQTPTYYAPTVNLVGIDEFGAAFSKSSSLPAQSLLITAVQIESISAPAYVSSGTLDTVTVRILNPTSSTVTINNVLPRFIGPGANFSPEPGIGLPRTVTQFTSTDVKVPVYIGAGSIGPYTINATVEGEIAGKPVVDDDVAPNPAPSWTVQSGAVLSYVASSLAPDHVSQGQSQAFSAQVQNAGGATVTLDVGPTLFEFTDGVDTYSATLTQAQAIAGNTTQALLFAAQTVPSMTPGSYTATVYLSGTENGVPFADTLTADLVTVEEPAGIVEAPNALDPNQVSHNQSVSFTVALTDTGGASVVLDPASTTISFGLLYTAQLNPSGITTLGPGTSTITFSSVVVNPSIVPSTYNPTVHIEGTENGKPYQTDIVLTDSVTVQEAPQFAVTGVVPSQGTFTATQNNPITVKVAVANNGAAVDFQNASLSLLLGGVSKTSQFNILPPTQFAVHGTRLQGGETDTLVFTVQRAVPSVSTGLMTIEASVTVQDVNSGLPITNDPAVSSKGSLLVQSPGVLQLLALFPEQTTVTQSMTKAFDVDLVVHNDGGSDLTLDLTDPASRLTFSPPDGWAATVAGTLAGGGNTLSGGETDTVSFTVTPSGSQLGQATVGAVVAATENNSGVARDGSGSSLATITVEAPAQLAITSVTLSRDSLTDGASVPWQIVVGVANNGEADLDLDLPAGLDVTFQDATAPPSVTKPLILDGDGTVLGTGGTGTLTIPVAGTGTFSPLGDKQVTVSLGGTELNSGDPVSDNRAATVTIQAVPDAAYIAASLSPDTVSIGTDVEFNVQVQNTVANGATIDLDEAQTTLSFDGGNFTASLKAGDNTIPGGATRTLVFTSQTIPLSATPGQQGDVAINLVWSQNGVSGGKSLAVPPADLVLQNAPDLSIQQIYASRATVTAGLQGPWHVTMVLMNAGETAVEIDPSVVNTYLTLRTLGGLDKTSEYTIVAPTQLEGEGSLILPGGSTTDSLIFDITSTGTTTGTIVISGRVQGRNVLNSDILTDAVQGGSFVVQTPADLQIVQVVPGRTTATVGQTSSYKIRMAVKNAGQAAALVNLNATTFLEFSGSTGWVYTVDPQLSGGGNTLSGGETDSVVFTVNTTGGPVGETTIGGTVSGVEANRPAVPLTDTATAGESGTITLQVAAAIVVDNVAVSRTTITQNTSVPWNVVLTIRNINNGSTAQLLLPDSVGVTIQDGSISWSPVNGLDQGGTMLDGGETGTLTIPITATGSFTSPGLKTIDIDVAYVDLNSGDINHIVDQGTITVQDPPDLQYVGGSLAPDTASTNSVVRFQIQVRNVGVNSATAVLDRATTRLYFDSGPTIYSAFLDINSADTVVGGTTETLDFEAKELTSQPAKNYPVYLALAYNANGVRTAPPASVLPDSVHVDVAPALQIVNIDVSQPRVTAGMTKEWTATMSLMNNGPSGVDLYLSADSTRIVFNKTGVPGELTGYTVVQPTALVSGGTVLPSDQSGQLVFRITQTGLDLGDITVNGVVMGDDLGSEEIVTDDTFQGGSGSVIVETAADLVTTMSILSPPGAKDGSVSVNQQFVVGAVVRNNGQAAVTGTSELTLAIPAGFSLPNNDATKAFGVAAGDTTKWTVQAPGTQQAAEYLTASISTRPNEVNTGDPAASSQPSDSVAVSVNAGGAFGSTSLDYDSPGGALDSTISTGQSFSVRIHATPSADAIGVGAELLPPAGFTPVGTTTKSLGDGDGTDKTTTFTMIAPANAASRTIRVELTATDRNTNQPVTPDTLVLPVEVVPRTRLTLSAAVTAPPDAIDQNVTVGTPFTVTANVANVAGGAGIAAPGQLRITVPTAKGYQLASGEPTTKSFTIGANVSWVVEAAPQPSGPDSITIAIVLPAPNDENAGTEAEVDGGLSTIAMNTEGAAVTVLDVTDSLGLDTRVAPAGTPNLRVFGFNLAYSNTDPLAADARIDTFAVTIVSGNGTPLSSGTVQRTLSRLFVQLGTAGTYETTNITGNPIVVAFTGAGSDRIIAPGGNQTATVGVDLGGNPAAEEIRLQIRGAGIIVRDVGSNQTLGVIERSTGQPLDGRLTSRPLVILGGNFEEYAHNYPNPFSPMRHGRTHIAYFLDRAAAVSMKIYSITGELVYEETLDRDDPRAATTGPHELEWDGRNMQGEMVRNGIYVCVLNAGSNSAKIRIAVAK